jgi:hypothetical protein
MQSNTWIDCILNCAVTFDIMEEECEKKNVLHTRHPSSSRFAVPATLPSGVGDILHPEYDERNTFLRYPKKHFVSVQR